jgi:hypothetical protein
MIGLGIQTGVKTLVGSFEDFEDLSPQRVGDVSSLFGIDYFDEAGSAGVGCRKQNELIAGANGSDGRGHSDQGQIAKLGRPSRLYFETQTLE